MERWQLTQLQALPLEVKIKKTKQRIAEWYDFWNGQISVSFSGGKDSTVLLHITRQLYPEVPAVFSDTGLEYPEIRDFVKSIEHTHWIYPQKYNRKKQEYERISFKQILMEYGYPVISKEVAEAIQYGRKNLAEQKDTLRLRRLTGLEKNSQFDLSKWEFLLYSDIPISNRCCYYMKKAPLNRYTRSTGRYPLVGTMAQESRLRTSSWLKHGCNAFDASHPKSTPLSFWTEQDILTYIRRYHLPYASIYGDIIDVPDGRSGAGKSRLVTTGVSRSGCMFCMFGAHLEKCPNRFQLMKATHPKQYDYCMRPLDSGGLGIAKVLEELHIPY